MTRKQRQSFDAKPPTCVENVNVLSAVKLRERLHSTQVSTVMTRKQSFENVNVLMQNLHEVSAVKLRHSSETEF